jgi:hypothetical protein
VQVHLRWFTVVLLTAATTSRGALPVKDTGGDRVKESAVPGVKEDIEESTTSAALRLPLPSTSWTRRKSLRSPACTVPVMCTSAALK